MHYILNHHLILYVYYCLVLSSYNVFFIWFTVEQLSAIYFSSNFRRFFDMPRCLIIYLEQNIFHPIINTPHGCDDDHGFKCQ